MRKNPTERPNAKNFHDHSWNPRVFNNNYYFNPKPVDFSRARIRGETMRGGETCKRSFEGRSAKNHESNVGIMLMTGVVTSKKKYIDISIWPFSVTQGVG